MALSHDRWLVERIDEQGSQAKAGFVMEGILRRAQARSDGRHDLKVCSHLTT
jgi:hypothetical protein